MEFGRHAGLRNQCLERGGSSPPAGTSGEIIMNKILLVGGTWDDKGGRPSKIINNVYKAIKPMADTVLLYNGGHYNALGYALDTTKFANLITGIKSSLIDVVLWFPDIPNKFKKDVDVKGSLSKAILITSKNNYNKSYTFQELVAHALSLKSNLFLEITKEADGLYGGQIFDTLGNVWSDKTTDFPALVIQALERAVYLKNITRKPTIWSPESPGWIPLTDETKKFFEVVQKSATRFHDLIHPVEGVKRFLGNASFRCMSGFPSLRGENGHLYVSRRNIDKRALGRYAGRIANGFVQVGYNDIKDITWYRGEHKPSVDTVVQVRLYSWLHKIRFMIHSHVYIENTPFTKNMVPCGGMEEVGEIERALFRHRTNILAGFAVNLIGHGSLICAQCLEDFGQFNYIQRPTPELLYKQLREN